MKNKEMPDFLKEIVNSVENSDLGYDTEPSSAYYYGFEDCFELMSRPENIYKMHYKQMSALQGFVEYFEQLEKGNYSKTRPNIRTFEQVLLSVGREALTPFQEGESDE